MTDDQLARDLRDAIAARRPPPPRQLAGRLIAAAAGPARPRIFAPAVLAAAVAALALVVLATRPAERTGDHVVVVVAPPMLPAGGAGGSDMASPPGPPPDLAAYDAVLSEASSVAVTAAQRGKIRAIAEALARDRATHRERKRTAEIDLRAELGRATIDTTRATAAFDRVASEDISLGRAELIARLETRAALDPQQRAAVESRTAPRPPSPPPATVARAQLSVVSATPGKVFVDGKEVGTTPVRVTVTPGVHQVRVEYAGYTTSENTVDVGAGSTVTVRPDPPQPTGGATGTLVVTANKAGVVTIDGKVAGDTPIKINLAPGRHKVNVVRDESGGGNSAHVSRTEEIMIEPGKVTRIAISLSGE